MIYTQVEQHSAGSNAVATQHQHDSRQRGELDDLGVFDEVRLAFRLYRDPRVSTALKSIIPILAVLYVLSPIDVIPDLLLGVGQVDDLGVIGIAIVATLKLIRRWSPSTIVGEHLDAMGRTGNRTSGHQAAERQDEVIETTFTVGAQPHSRQTANGTRRVA